MFYYNVTDYSPTRASITVSRGPAGNVIVTLNSSMWRRSTATKYIQTVTKRQNILHIPTVNNYGCLRDKGCFKRPLSSPQLCNGWKFSNKLRPSKYFLMKLRVQLSNPMWGFREVSPKCVSTPIMWPLWRPNIT